MRMTKAKAHDTDTVIVTREREGVIHRQELRIGKDPEREGYYTLAAWSENYKGELAPYSQIFTVDKGTLAKIRDAITGILDEGAEAE